MKTKIALLLLTALGMTYYWPQPPTNDDARHLLHEVCKLVKDHHLQPRPLNDELSQEMFQMYLSEIDPEKVFFTQKEVAQLSHFELLLDEELNNGTFDFYERSVAILAEKIERVSDYYPDILSEGLNLEQSELLETSPDKLEFAANEDMLRDRWRKLVKQRLLEELWMEEQETGKTQVEQSEAARKRTLRYFDKQFERYRSVTDQERLGQYVNAYLKIHDVQTEYLLPAEKEGWDADFTRSLVGIGAQIEMVNEYPQLLELVVGGPAWKSQKLDEGDRVLQIGEAGQAMVDVFGTELPQVLQLLRGEEGSTVILLVKKEDARTEEVRLVREKVALDQAMAFSIDPAIGYIKLPRFYAGDSGCATDVLRQIEQFNEQSIEGLIIDLRDNKGGSAREVIKILGCFIEEGIVMQSSYRDGGSRQYEDEDTSVKFAGKILIMVNTRSSSGSELFAGTLQDYQRAIVVGSKATYGKGSIQRFFEIAPEAAAPDKSFGNLKLTIGRFYTAAGRSPQYSGITPDIILPDATDGIPSGERVYPYAMKVEDLPIHQVFQSVCTPPETPKLREQSRNRVEVSPRFKLMEKYALSIKENWDNTRIELNFEASKRAKMTQLKQKAQLDTFYQPIPGFEVQPMPEQDLVKKHKAEQWRERIQNDPYVQECYFIMRDMVGQSLKFDLLNPFNHLLMKKLLFACMCGFLLGCASSTEDQVNTEQTAPFTQLTEVNQPSFQSVLDSAQLTGTMLLFDPQKKQYYSNDFERARQGNLPASTFKIPNSIIALETGVVEDDSTLFKWDGQKRRLPIWEQDMIFREAFHRSCVPCYQEVARKVGVERMREYVQKLNYGEIVVDSNSIDLFWLEGESRIDAFQQIDFLQRFYEGLLPIAEHTTGIMKRMMLIDANADYKISGKTGWSIRNGNDNGWFVGYVEKGDATYYFATNVEPGPEFDMDNFPAARKEVTMQVLAQMGIIH